MPYLKPQMVTRGVRLNLHFLQRTIPNYTYIAIRPLTFECCTEACLPEFIHKRSTPRAGITSTWIRFSCYGNSRYGLDAVLGVFKLYRPSIAKAPVEQPYRGSPRPVRRGICQRDTEGIRKLIYYSSKRCFRLVTRPGWANRCRQRAKDDNGHMSESTAYN